MHGERHLDLKSDIHLRLHLYYWHKHQPRHYLDDFGFSKENIGKLPSYCRDSIVTYRYHRGIMRSLFEKNYPSLNSNNYAMMLNKEKETKLIEIGVIVKEKDNDEVVKKHFAKIKKLLSSCPVTSRLRPRTLNKE